MKAVIFDLDQTLLDTSLAEPFRKQRNWRKVYELIPKFTIYEGINDLLAWLSLNCKTAIVTSSPSAYCNRVLTRAGWKFDACVCYHDTTRHKPHPAPLHEALLKLGVSASDAVSIGDHPDDAVAARGAGIVSVRAVWGKMDTALPLKEKADFLCETVKDLRARLMSFGIGQR